MGRVQLAMEKVAKNDGIMVVHAEDDDLVQFNYEKFAAEGRTEGWNMNLVHTKLSEELAFDRIIRLARASGAGVYFVHTSAREGVEAVAEARGRNLPIYCETLHHYACFSADDYKTPLGFCYHTYPSLKGRDDNKALWDGLINDAVSTTATDEFPTSLDHKLSGKRIDNVTGGNLGAEARMGIVYTEGVVKRGMTLQRFADVTSTNAARMQRRRHRAHRPIDQEEADTRGLPRERLQPMGRMAGRRVAGDDNIARQGDRRERQAAGGPELWATHPAQAGSGCIAPASCLRRREAEKPRAECEQ
jgi:dihydropyrimidinase